MALDTLILDGKAVAETEKKRIAAEVAALGRRIKLTVILVGQDPASSIYVSSKEKACIAAGIDSEVVRLPEDTPQEALLAEIKTRNADPSVTGILVQLPLPPHIDENTVVLAIDPRKDVDCFHPENSGRLFAGNPRILPCTPAGVMKILSHYRIDLKGREAVVLGRSNIVGKPQAMLLLASHATVTICHSRTQNLAEVTRRADILVAAIGKPAFVKADMVKKGAVVVDVGINRIEDGSCAKGYRVVGDVDYQDVLPVASAITPVPGGVGVMTIVMLLDNVLKLARMAES